MASTDCTALRISNARPDSAAIVCREVLSDPVMANVRNRTVGAGGLLFEKGLAVHVTCRDLLE
jgi:hypothetical protein